MIPFGGCEPDSGISPVITVIPCGYEVSTTFYPGTRFGPRRLLEASTEIELFDFDFGISPHTSGIRTAPEPEIIDDSGAMISKLEAVVAAEYEKESFPIIIGGEHTLAVSGASAAVSKYPGLGFIQIDAHADFRDSYRGNRLNHACVGRRLSEIGPLVQIGIRSMCEEEYGDLMNSPVTVYPASGFRRNEVKESMLAHLPDTVYISIDLDGFDPSIVPGVGNPEPGGLGWTDVTELLQTLFSKRTVIGADLCELSPIPGSAVSESLAARLVLRLCSLHVRALKEKGDNR